MPIIVSRKGLPATLVCRSQFQNELDLQEYIHEHPESIPVYDIHEDKRLFVAAREFPTQSGPIDALAIDKDGDIYIVETKLYKNPDKRTVVAQALDYGASLWKHSSDFAEFLSTLDRASREKWHTTFLDRAKQILSLADEEGEDLLEAMSRNLREGCLKFVILMDSIDERLKDLITYVNQNSQFDLYAVQLEFYKHEEYEIVIPKLYGAEVRKEVTSPTSSRRRRWDEGTMLEQARARMNAEEFGHFEQIYRFAKDHAYQINFGTGSYATFSPIFQKICNKSLFTLGIDKRLSFNFEWVARENQKACEVFKQALDEIGFRLPADCLHLRPSVTIDEWGPRIDTFLNALRQIAI